MKSIRLLQFKINQCRNFLSLIINRFRFKLYGVVYGKNCRVYGKLYIKLFPDTNVKIGDNFFCSSGQNVNALCANKRGVIYLVHSATLIIGNNVGMSSPVIWCNKRIIIGDNVKIGANVILMDTDAHSTDFLLRRDSMHDWSEPEAIVIDNDAFIGMNVTILKGVHVGARAIIGAGSIVSHDVPSDCIAAGNPAKIIRRIDS